MFRDNFLLGLEIKTLGLLVKIMKTVVQFQKEIDKTDRDLYPNGCGTHPHQIYNEFLSEHGILGSYNTLFNFKINFKKF